MMDNSQETIQWMTKTRNTMMRSMAASMTWLLLVVFQALRAKKELLENLPGRRRKRRRRRRRRSQ